MFGSPCSGNATFLSLAQQSPEAVTCAAGTDRMTVNRPRTGTRTFFVSWPVLPLAASSPLENVYESQSKKPSHVAFM